MMLRTPVHPLLMLACLAAFTATAAAGPGYDVAVEDTMRRVRMSNDNRNVRS